MTEPEESKGMFELRLRLPERVRDLPWGHINWFLHGLWFFVILLLWNALSDSEDGVGSLEVSLTVFEIFLVALAFAGFWMLRGEVREETRKALGPEIEKLEPKVLRFAEEWLELRASGKIVENTDIERQKDAFRDE